MEQRLWPADILFKRKLETNMSAMLEMDVKASGSCRSIKREKDVKQNRSMILRSLELSLSKWCFIVLQKETVFETVVGNVRFPPSCRRLSPQTDECQSATSFPNPSGRNRRKHSIQSQATAMVCEENRAMRSRRIKTDGLAVSPCP